MDDLTDTYNAMRSIKVRVNGPEGQQVELEAKPGCNCDGCITARRIWELEREVNRLKILGRVI